MMLQPNYTEVVNVGKIVVVVLIFVAVFILGLVIVMANKV